MSVQREACILSPGGKSSFWPLHDPYLTSGGGGAWREACSHLFFQVRRDHSYPGDQEGPLITFLVAPGGKLEGRVLALSPLSFLVRVSCVCKRLPLALPRPRPPSFLDVPAVLIGPLLPRRAPAEPARPRTTATSLALLHASDREGRHRGHGGVRNLSLNKLPRESISKNHLTLLMCTL